MRALTLTIVTSLVATASTSGCQDDAATPGSADTGPSANADAQRELLGALATEVFLATYTEFEAAVADLDAAAVAWAASDSDTDRDAARQAWLSAMAIRQRAELLDVGPQGDPQDAELGVAGGQGLRLEIYSWPTVNPCRVDVETAAGTYQNPDALLAQPANVRGLDALEYLLWAEGTGNACKPQSALNTSGDWAAVEGQVAERRADYVAALTGLLKTRARTLREAWDPAADDFAGQLGQAGTGSMTYASAQAALNAVSDALFYLDKAVKDMKVAVPAGISGCSLEACPEDVESKHARRSKDHVLANLRGFERVFLGGPAGTDAIGFDDLLVAVGAGALAETMTGQIAAAIAAVEAIEGDLASAVQTDREAVLAAHTALKTLTANLKTQFLSVLDLEIPKRVASDND